MSITSNDFLNTATVAEFDELKEAAVSWLLEEDQDGELYGESGDGAVDQIDAWLNQTGLDKHRAQLFSREMADVCDE